MDNELLKSITIQDELNPKVWTTKGDIHIMKPEIREGLLKIAYEYIDFLDVDIIISDIILTGSLANYNWSKYSDFDLHIVANFNQYPENQKELYEKLFSLKKMIFNDKHDITIKDYEVELYVQDESETHFSSGVYSILFDKWMNKPKKENFKLDKKSIKEKTKQWMRIIDNLIDSIKDDDVDMAKEMISKYKEKLKKYRSCGLEDKGEYSTENLVFKLLRRNEYISKVIDMKRKLYVKQFN